MLPNRFSLIVMFAPEENSPFASEVENFVDVLIPPDTATMSEFINARQYLVEHLTEEYGLNLEKSVDEDGSVALCLFGLEDSDLDFEKVIDSVYNVFLTEIENAGFEVIARGMTTQELKIALDNQKDFN